jgi:hypothetical protein
MRKLEWPRLFSVRRCPCLVATIAAVTVFVLFSHDNTDAEQATPTPTPSDTASSKPTTNKHRPKFLNAYEEARKAAGGPLGEDGRASFRTIARAYAKYGLSRPEPEPTWFDYLWDYFLKYVFYVLVFVIVCLAFFGPRRRKRFKKPN